MINLCYTKKNSKYVKIILTRKKKEKKLTLFEDLQRYIQDNILVSPLLKKET